MTRPCGVEPAHWAAALAFGLVALAETGRQPVDNPDTHLELTMVHEGPLLEYAGRDLAYLQWAAAARHWIMLVLATRAVRSRSRARSRAQLAVLAASLPVWCVVLAVIETTQAKMRILRVPVLPRLPGGACACWGWRAGSPGAAHEPRRDLGAGDQRTRRGRRAAALGRDRAVALQSLLLGVQAIDDAAGESTALLVAGTSC